MVRTLRVSRGVAVGGLPPETALLRGGQEGTLAGGPFQGCNKLLIHLYVLLAQQGIHCMTELKESSVGMDWDGGARNEEERQGEEGEGKGGGRLEVVWAVLVVLTGATVAAMVLLLLYETSEYFSRVFGVFADESLSKRYLKQHYRPYLTTVYLSSLGLVIVGADTLLYFLKFSQKHKLLCIHLTFFVLLITSGAVTLTDYPYQSHMSSLQGLTTTDPGCSSSGYTNQCLLAQDYERYRQQMLVFVVVGCVVFAGYAAVFHAGVVCRKEGEGEKRGGGESKEGKENKGQETFVSEIFDDYQS